MKSFRHAAGVDAGKSSFVLAIRTLDDDPIIKSKSFKNTRDGADKALAFVVAFGADPAQTLLCVEHVGVYAEKLCYYLQEKTGMVFMADPEHVHRSMKDRRLKTDKMDAIRIAHYGVRFTDFVRPFKLKNPLVERIEALLQLRRATVKERTRYKNQLKSLRHKWSVPAEAEMRLQAMIDLVSKHISDIELEIQSLIKTDSMMAQGVSILKSMPGVGLILATAMLVLTNGFEDLPSYRQASSYLGMAPKPYESGESVRRPSRSRGDGHSMMRQLLYLSARSLITARTEARSYFARKVQMGKPKTLVLNNLGNKQLKVMLALLRTWKPYDENYRSINPSFALTKP